MPTFDVSWAVFGTVRVNAADPDAAREVILSRDFKALAESAQSPLMAAEDVWQPVEAKGRANLEKTAEAVRACYIGCRRRRNPAYKAPRAGEPVWRKAAERLVACGAEPSTHIDAQFWAAAEDMRRDPMPRELGTDEAVRNYWRYRAHRQNRDRVVKRAQLFDDG